MGSRTLIVGAGPAGLAGAFWRLQVDPAADVVVCEAAPRVGGWVQTELRDGYRCEIGPQAVRPGPELDALVAALGLEDRLLPAAATAKQRWIGRGGRLLPVPAGPMQLLRTPLLSLSGKLRLLREPFVRGGDPTAESITTFISRRFGREAAPLVQAMVSGIYAGDADQLEVESAFPMLALAEREAGSVFKGLIKARKRAKSKQVEPAKPRPKRASLYSFTSGMGELVQALLDRLGDRVRTGTEVRALRRHEDGYEVEFADGETMCADEVVLACPARRAAAITAGLDATLSTELGAIPFSSVASVYLGFPAAAAPPELQGFGFLLDRSEQSSVLGAIYVGSLFPDHVPAGQGLLRVMLGGRLHPEVVGRSDAELVELALATVARYAKCRLEPDFVHVGRAGEAIAQYEHGHAARMARIEARLEHFPGLSLRGNSYRAIALSGQLGQQSGTDCVGEA